MKLQLKKLQRMKSQNGFNGILTRDLRDTGAMLLSYEGTHWEGGQLCALYCITYFGQPRYVMLQIQFRMIMFPELDFSVSTLNVGGMAGYRRQDLDLTGLRFKVANNRYGFQHFQAHTLMDQCYRSILKIVLETVISKR